MAGISLSLVLGNNGIITKAKESRAETRMAQIDEQVKLAIGDAYTEGLGSITDSGLKSALNNHLGEGTYDITGDETTGWQVTVKETGKTYDIASNGKINSSEETGSTVDWNKILEEANKNPESFKHPEQSETNNDIGIGTDGKPVNMDLWNAIIINGNEITLTGTDGCNWDKGYVGKIIDGKIQGKIPAYIKPAGSDKFYTVTSMKYTFAYCEDLEEMTEEIPSKVTNFDYMYEGCTKLTKITLQNIPEPGEIGYYPSITSIIIPKNVENIDAQLFNENSLQEIIVDNENKCYSSVNGVLFDKDKKTIIAYPTEKSGESYEIPDSVTSIGDGAFYGCTSLTSITIPDSVTSISNVAFWECSSLTSVTIPDSVTSIGEGTFAECSSLTSVTIPDSVTSIGEGAFTECTGLTSIVIPEGVKEIKENPFPMCYSLQGIEVNEKNKYYLSENGILFDKDKKTIIAYPAGKSVESYEIPDSVTSIGNSAFWGCSSLTSITIPDSVTSISDGAFSGCSSLTSITIPDSVPSIGDRAFSGCTSLTSITIPKNVSSIGNYAFEDCDSLANVYFEETTTPDFCRNSFYRDSGVKTIFHFKNQEVYDAFTESYYNKNYGEKSTDFNW